MDRQTDTEMDRQAHRYTDGHKQEGGQKHMGIQTNELTYRWTYADKWIDKQMDRQAFTDK